MLNKRKKLFIDNIRNPPFDVAHRRESNGLEYWWGV